MKVAKVILFDGPDGPVVIRPNPKAQRPDESEDQFLARVWKGQPHPEDAVPVIVDVSDVTEKFPDRSAWIAEVQKRARQSRA